MRKSSTYKWLDRPGGLDSALLVFVKGPDMLKRGLWNQTAVVRSKHMALSLPGPAIHQVDILPSDRRVHVGNK